MQAIKTNTGTKSRKATAVKYLLRIAALYVLSLLFKSFDMSFNNTAHIDKVRIMVFSIIYVAYGLLAWEGAARIASAVEKRYSHKSNVMLLQGGLLLGYGIVVAFVFALVYGVSDIAFFNRYEAWIEFTRVSYDLIFGTFIFYTLILAVNGIVFYYRQWKTNLLHTERLMRENTEAKYEALRNQIDPHFFFNSLSVLTNLVYKDADTAADYITQLAKTYRYILDKKFENLVSIETELEFLQSYLFLIRIRHQDSVQFSISIDEETKTKGCIPPATLQMLFENAIKHNRFSATVPLMVTLESHNGYLVMRNSLRRKTQHESSSGIGLENIQKRYELSGNSSVSVQESNGEFIVSIPIIKK